MELAVEDREETAAPTPAIQAFIDTALARFPELDDSSGPECPWASAPLAGGAVGDLIHVSMTYSGAEYAGDPLAEIAASLGLVCFDPQIGRLLPDAEPTPTSMISATTNDAPADHVAGETGEDRSSWFRRLFGQR